MPHTKTAQEVNNEIREVTVPLAQALRTLADNVKGSKEGREKAAKNADVVDDFNRRGEALMNQLTQNKSLGVGLVRGSSSSNRDQDDRK